MEDVDLDTQLNVFEDEALADEELLLENLNLEDLAFGYPRRDRGGRFGGLWDQGARLAPEHSLLNAIACVCARCACSRRPTRSLAL